MTSTTTTMITIVVVPELLEPPEPPWTECRIAWWMTVEQLEYWAVSEDIIDRALRSHDTG